MARGVLLGVVYGRGNRYAVAVATDTVALQLNNNRKFLCTSC